MKRQATTTTRARRRRRRRLFTEQLEDRRLLAALDLIPATGVGTVTEETRAGQTVTVITVAPGTKFNVEAQVLPGTPNTPVQSYQLGFRESSPDLILDNFAAGDFTNVIDGTLDSMSGDRTIGAAIENTGTELEPPRSLGTFDVMAPTTTGEFTLTARAEGPPETTQTQIGDSLGQLISVSDFGDLIINVQPVATAGATLDLIPAASAGTVTEETRAGRTVTVITVAPGTKFNVEAQVLTTPDNTPIQSYQLGFRDSSTALILDNFAAGDFTNVIDGTLDSTSGDRTIGAAIENTGTELAPPRSFGTFDVMAPTTTGEFTLTVGAEGPPETTQTQIGDRLGQLIPVSDFGDLIINVQPVATAGATLNLIPAASAGTVTEETRAGRAVTVITVAPGTKFNVEAQVLTTPDNTPIQSYQLGFRDSSTALILDNFAAGDFTNVIDGTLDSASGDRTIGAAIENTGTELAPPRSFGTFDVMAPTTTGEFTLTVGAEGPPETTQTQIGDRLGQLIPVSDFGDLIINVQPVATAGATLNLIPAASAGTVTEETRAGQTVTVITVAPGTKFNVEARVLTTPDNTPIQSYQLGFRDSSTALILDNFAAGDFTNVIDGTLDSASGDRTIGAAIENTGTELAPPRSFGTFDVMAPTTTGEFTLTVGAEGPPETTQTQIGDRLGQLIPVSDFGDLIINVSAVVQLPTVSVSVNPTSVLEDGTQNLTYTFTRDTTSTSPLTVNYSTGGTATAGTDFSGTNASVTIPANAVSATVIVDPASDSDVEPDETVVLTITPNATVYTVGSPSAATGTITNDDPQVALPTVSVSVSPASVLEDGTPNLIYRFTRSVAGTSPLTVNYSTGGTATAGTDFSGTSASVTIPANVLAASVVVNPTPDTDVEPDETVVLTITPNTTAYTVGSPASATGTITNDDQAAVPTVSVSVSPTSVAEDGAANLIYRFTRDVASASPLTVNYSTTGTATAGTDFSGTSASVTIPANVLAASVVVNPTADADVEPDETVILSITPNAGVYTVGTPSAATGTITNDDQAALPTVSVSVSPISVAEDGTQNLTYTFTRDATSATALTVNYGTSGTATAGTDFSGTSNGVTIPANAVSATVVVDPTADDTFEPDETVILTITSNASVYTVGSPAAATGTITNDDPPSDCAGVTDVLFTGGVVTVCDGDDIEFFQFGGVGDLMVRVDGVMSGPFANPTRLVAFGNEGDDSIVVVPNTINIPADFRGGPGNDIIFGAAGDDVIDGGTGNDTIYGMAGNNTLIGGTGTDKLFDGRNARPIADTTGLGATTGPTSTSRTLVASSGPLVENSGSSAGSTSNVAAQVPLVARSVSSANSTSDAGSSSETNPARPSDVNADGETTARDALIVINGLDTERGEGENLRARDGYFRDVNGDSQVTARDALAVINALNRTATGRASAEGEQDYSSFAAVGTDGHEDDADRFDEALMEASHWLF